MKTLKLVTSLFIVNCFGFSAFGSFDSEAGVTGTWSGKGMWIQKSSFAPINKQEPCSKIEIKITESGESFSVDRYHAVCGMMDSDWGPLKFEIKDGKVYNEGDEVGTFDGELFKTLMPENGVQYAFNFQLIKTSGKITEFRSYYGVRNMVGATVVEGTLTQSK